LFELRELYISNCEMAIFQAVFVNI